MEQRPQTVVAAPAFLASAKAAGISDEELADFTAYIARNPQAGVVVPGTGGARKVRVAAKGRGKSGSYRTYHFYGGDDVPVFLIAAFAKNKAADLSPRAKAELAKTLPLIADAYRASVAARVAKLRKRK